MSSSIFLIFSAFLLPPNLIPNSLDLCKKEHILTQDESLRVCQSHWIISTWKVESAFYHSCTKAVPVILIGGSHLLKFFARIYLNACNNLLEVIAINVNITKWCDRILVIIELILIIYTSEIIKQVHLRWTSKSK